MPQINLLRVYDACQPMPDNSFLTDRLWPRGLNKERLAGVEWLKSVAPSNELRRWFHANTDQWSLFEQKYRTELWQNDDWRLLLALLKQQKTVTLMYSSRDTQHNQAVVLRQFLLEQLGGYPQANSFSDSDKKSHLAGG